MAFLTELEIRNADSTDDGQWVLLAPLEYWSPGLRRFFTVPAGFQTDLASVPRVPIAYVLCGGTSNEAAALHDYLYAAKPVPRAKCDMLLREASGSTGVPAWRRWLMWAGVRAFGFIAWREDIGKKL